MTKIALPPEKLGSFFLGAEYDISKKEILDNSINYDARDLTTHAICVGMTGSGKTGLCVGLLEEAAMDKVPAIIIDPKGDMTNLLLQFDKLSPEQFEPWINEDDARRKELTVKEYAEATAKKWQNGLAGWGQDTERIKKLNSIVDYTVFTPGSNAGIPINIMGSFAAPAIDFEEEAEMLLERIQGTVAALLGMIGSNADPVRSKEGILLANIFEHHWRKGEDLDITKLILGIQKPPFSKLGVFDLESFYSEKDRFELSMALNSLVASPQFKYWLEGEDLDIAKLYFTADGKPRHSIMYIAHLSDSERMFFVTLLLNSLITWMRRQSGTTTLRSLIYFDEIFGYFPPTANPPSKQPLLTILKQARAFGLGAILVTQNPVDIDYKGLSNAGTWFIGKLQTERDKMRVLDGLKGAIAQAGQSTKMNFDQIISSLSSRVFLLHNVHGEDPVVFHTRWVMSYLRGPLTRPQVKKLMAVKKSSKESKNNIISNKSEGQINLDESSVQPSLDPGINQRFFSIWKSGQEAMEQLGENDLDGVQYVPKVLATAKVRFYDSRKEIDEVKSVSLLSGQPDDFGRLDWTSADQASNWQKNVNLGPDKMEGIKISYGAVPEQMNTVKEFSSISKEFENWIYQNVKHLVYEHKALKLVMKKGEPNEDFLMRVQQAAKEQRDEELESIKEKYESKFDRIEDKIRKEEYDLAEAEAEVKDRRNAEMIGMAETIFSVFVKGRSRSFSSAASKNRMKRRAKQKLEESHEDLNELREDYKELETNLQEDLDAITSKWDNTLNDIQTIEIKPRKTDILVEDVLITWEPFWKAGSGRLYSARKT